MNQIVCHSADHLVITCYLLCYVSNNNTCTCISVFRDKHMWSDSISKYTNLGYYLTAWTRSAELQHPSKNNAEMPSTIIFFPLRNLDSCLITNGLNIQESLDWRVKQCAHTDSDITHILLFAPTSEVQTWCNSNNLL